MEDSFTTSQQSMEQSLHLQSMKRKSREAAEQAKPANAVAEPAPATGVVPLRGKARQRLRGESYFTANQAPAAASMACRPVVRVGWMTGANCGEWLLGMLLRLPAATALAYWSGSVPPTNQNT